MKIEERNYRFYVAKQTCPKFPKGIYVYRKINDDLSLIPKGLYVSTSKFDI